jgi:uncharacterized alkaline shock family protein YloU
MPASKTGKSTKTTTTKKSTGTATSRKKTTKSATKAKLAADTIATKVPELPITPETGIETSIEEITTNISAIDTANLVNETPIREQPVIETEIPAGEIQFFRNDGFDISKKVLARIALMAAGEVDGFAPAKKDPVNRLFDTFQGRTDGIRVDVGTTEAAVDMQIRVQFGSDIPEITNRLRERVSTRIREMTGLNVVEVNIRVQDVTLPSPTV